MKQGHLVAESVKNYTNYIKQNATRQEEYFKFSLVQAIHDFFVQDSIQVCKSKAWNQLCLLGSRESAPRKKKERKKNQKKKLGAEHRGVAFLLLYFSSLWVSCLRKKEGD